MLMGDGPAAEHTAPATLPSTATRSEVRGQGHLCTDPQENFRVQTPLREVAPERWKERTFKVLILKM